VGQRTVLVTAHIGRENALRSARFVADRLTAAGIAVRTLAGEFASPGTQEVPASAAAAEGAELVIVLGGDGSLLRAAELSRPAGVPLIGVNLGHVGFLAEAEPRDLAGAVDRVVKRAYAVEERMTVDVTVRHDGARTDTTWALNEASVEKAARQRMLEVIIEIDDRPLSKFGCDGVVCATPTGSTAYNFSIGGPIVSPTVECLLVGAAAAHSSFNRSLLLSLEEQLCLDVLPSSGRLAVEVDGIVEGHVSPGDMLSISSIRAAARVVRLGHTTFYQRARRKLQVRDSVEVI